MTILDYSIFGIYMLAENTYDRIEKFHDATIQHGSLNDRIYLMKIGAADPAVLVRQLDQLAAENGYSKIFAKIPANLADDFIQNGYEQEACIPLFYNGEVDGLFLAKYSERKRGLLENRAELDKIISLARSKAGSGTRNDLPAGSLIRTCGADDAEEMSNVYREVFPSYPFPIDDASYLRATMESHIRYFAVELEGKLLALSSAEMDRGASNVEMTDFATLPEWLGNGFAAHLLARMDSEMESAGFKTAYTIARAVSPGMNITFAKMGYRCGGLLKNNTNISGQIESMNIWFKPLE